MERKRLVANFVSFQPGEINKRSVERTILTTSGYMFSKITPRWVVMYSSISCRVCALICLPFSSELASLKSKRT